MDSYKLGNLNRLWDRYPRAYCELIQRSWATDPHRTGNSVVLHLNRLLADEETAVRVVKLPFFDTLDTGDWDIMEFLADISRSDPDGLSRLLRLESVASDSDVPIQVLYLETKDPAAAAKLAAQGWVRDGLSGLEGDALNLLQQAAIASNELFTYLVEGNSSWIPFPDAGAERAALEKLIAWSRFDEDTVLRLIDMPFLATVEGTDDEVVRHLFQLAKTNPEGVQKVLANPIISNGITDEMAVYVTILYLEQVDARLARSINDLAWVKDGISYLPPRNWGNINREPSEWESQIVLYLVDNALRAPDFLSDIAAKDWFRDGLSNLEVNVFFQFNDLTSRHADEAVDVINMPFMDTIEWDDLRPLQTLVRIARQRSVPLSQVLASPALAGGITDDNSAVVDLLEVKAKNASKGAALEALPWIRDGVNARESAGIAALTHAALMTDRLFSALVNKAWVRDGLTEAETIVIGRFVSISGIEGSDGTRLVERIVDMPFLNTFEAVDSVAVLSMYILAARGGGTYLQQILDHPLLEEGLMDRDALIIGVLHPLGRSSGSLRTTIDTLSDPALVSRQERSIILPLRGEMALAVVRVPAGSTRSLDIVESIVRQQEEFMHAAFPVEIVAIINARVGTHGAFDGLIALELGDEDNVQVIAREIADIYWRDGPGWLSDGAAEFMSTLAVNGLGQVPSSPGATLCNLSDTIWALDDLAYRPQNAQTSAQVATCMRRLGLGLYTDLFSRLGEEEFRRSFGSLYLKMRHRQHDNECAGIDYGLCYINEAFVEEAASEHSAIAADVISHWYYGAAR